MANMPLPPSGRSASTVTLSDSSDVENVQLGLATEGGTFTRLGDSGHPFPVSDNGSSITVDAPQGSVIATCEQLHVNNGVIVPMGTTAATIIAANTAGRERIIKNLDTTDVVFIGTTGVTATTGFPLGPGAVMVLNANNVIVGVTAANPVNVFVMETIAV